MDWAYINTLLSIIHQASSAGPKYAYITALAEAELHQAFNAPPADTDEEDDDGDDA